MAASESFVIANAFASAKNSSYQDILWIKAIEIKKIRIWMPDQMMTFWIEILKNSFKIMRTINKPKMHGDNLPVYRESE
jgi:hypothetical protein